MKGTEPIAPRPATSSLSDGELVAEILAGKPALFEVLMRRHNQRLYRALRSYLRDEADVEEAMQQAYFDAYQHLGEFAGKAAFSTWLLRIGINEALMRVRRQSRLRLVETSPGEEILGAAPADAPTPEEGVAGHELGRLAEAAIDDLEAPYKSVFMLREIEGLSTEDVAEALHLTKATVKQRLHRAKKQVKRSVYERMDRQLSGVFTFPATRCDRVVKAVFARLSIAR